MYIWQGFQQVDNTIKNILNNEDQIIDYDYNRKNRCLEKISRDFLKLYL